MATARARHYHTRSARLVTSLAVAAALPQPCHNLTLTLFTRLYDWAAGNRPIPQKEWQVIADLLGYPVEALAPQRTAHHMIQSLQDQSALPVLSYVPAESEVLVPPSVAREDAAVGTQLFDWPTRFGQQLTELQALLALWQAQRVPCQHLQALLHSELERWNTMGWYINPMERAVKCWCRDERLGPHWPCSPRHWWPKYKLGRLLRCSRKTSSPNVLPASLPAGICSTEMV